MLSNAYFLAKFRFDTAENEPAKNLQKFCKILQNLARFLPGRGGRLTVAASSGPQVLDAVAENGAAFAETDPTLKRDLFVVLPSKE